MEPHLLCVHINRNITITDVTDALCEVTGFAAKDLIGKPLRVLAANNGSGSPPVSQGIFDFIELHGGWSGEVKLLRKNGSPLWMDVIISPSRRQNDEGQYTVVYQDASKRKHFEKLATRDELTGLFNRRHFNILAPQLIKQAAKSKQFIGLLLLDVDKFKQYNDTYGHPAGDEVLTAIGSTMKQVLQRREEDAFRIGGEEFAAVSICGEKGEIVLLAEKIRKAVEGLNIKHQFSPTGVVTVSVGGYVMAGTEQTSLESLYANADKCLYNAKASGRNRCVVQSHPIS